MWDGIKDSKEASDFQAYLTQYPTGIFAAIAKNRMASLGTGAPREQPAAPAIQEPIAAPVTTNVSAEPVPVAEPASTEAVAGDGIVRDSHGVDCRIKDGTRSESDCRGLGRSGNGGGGYGGGSKTSGSHGWN
jgi:hypothetical protein